MNKSTKQFEDVKTDIFEQKHITNRRSEIIDHEIYVPCDIQSNEISFVKIIASDELREPISESSD